MNIGFRGMKTFIIAEIGINHNGDISIAKKLIDIAYESGCNAVKFQKRNPDECIPISQKEVMRETPWGEMTYIDYKHRMEFGRKEYDEIDKYCKEKDIEWFASAWDLDSQEFLKHYNCKYNKIASPMLTHKKLLEIIAKEKKYTFISTGMSTIRQISDAVKIFRKNKCPFELMHSHSVYPMPEEEANLNVIPFLKKKFKCKVGYSGHEVAAYEVCIPAVVLGATSIERHITLDRSMYGSDQAASLEPGGLERLVRDVRIIDLIMGDGVKRIWDSEIPVMKKLRNM